MQYPISKVEKIIGIFAVIAILIGATFLIFKIKEGKLFKKQITLVTVTDKGYGIIKGTVVKVNGLTAGIVENVSLDKDNAVLLTMSISRPFYENIHKDAVAQIIEPVIMGGTEINILPGSNNNPLITDGDFIKAQTFDNLAQKLENSFKEMEGTIRKAREIVDNVNKTTEKAREIADNINKTSENLASITSKADKGEGSLGKIINDPALYDGLKETIDSTHSILENIDKMAENLESITEKIDKGQGSLGQVINDPSLYNSAKDAVDSTRSIVESIKSTKIYVGLDTNYYYHQDVNISRFHLKVVPRESRYFWLGGAIFNPASDSPITTTENNEQNYKVSPEFILAQKIFDNRLTLRAGLFEGRFGGGIDYTPRTKEKNILHLTLEGRDTFDKKNFNEHLDKSLLRAKVRIQFSKYFHLEIGGDNLLNKPAFFVGIGFEYLDEDISKIVGLIGAGQ